MNCWICGANNITGEHLVKLTDLKSVFKNVSTHKPVFKKGNNRSWKIQSLDSKFFKSKTICAACNNATSKPFDKAWEKISKYLSDNTKHLKVNGRVKLSNVFPGEVNKSLVLIQLYFVKIFGCRIAEAGKNDCLAEFSQSIRNTTENLNVFLCIGWWEPKYKNTGISEIKSVNVNGKIHMLYWYYIVNDIVVYIAYVKNGVNPTRGCWLPHNAGKVISFSQEA